MSVSGILGWLNIRGLTVRIDLPDEVYRGVETLVTVRLANRKRGIPSFLLKVRLLGEAADFDVVGGGEEGRGSFLARFRERGDQVIAAGEVSSPFPINFFVRSRRVELNRRLTVFPAPLPCPLPAGAQGTERNGVLPDHAKGYEGEVEKIADYTGAEPLKLVHWRLSARHGELKVKELTAISQEPIMLDLAKMPGKTLEESLSSAVYLVNRLIRRNRRVGLKLGERLLQPAASRDHRLRLLLELARYGKN
jgi:uncharacterized protein (DUF58 family)